MRIGANIIAFIFLASCQGVNDTYESRTIGGKTSSTNNSNQNGGGTISQESQVKLLSIVDRSCSGSLCHDSGSPFKAYDNNISLIQQDAQKIIDRIKATDEGKKMPKPPSTLPAADLSFMVETLTTYLQPANSGGNNNNNNVSNATPPPAVGVVKVCPTLTDTQKTTFMQISFAAVDAVGAQNCGGGGCHSGSNTTGAVRSFVTRESLYNDKSYAAGIVQNMKNGSMPKGKSMTQADKDYMTMWICSRLDI